MFSNRVVAPLLGGVLLAFSCSFQPVSDVLTTLSSQERAAIAAQTAAPTPGCEARTLDDTACKTTSEWEATLGQDCAEDGKTASRALFAGACGPEAFKFAAFECCGGARNPELTVCPGGQLYQDGGPTSCKEEATWTLYATYDCQQLGQALGEIAFVEECEPGSFRTMRYTCCPSPEVPQHTLWNGDMGPCRPDLLGNSSGWSESGSGCGTGGACEGYSWSFYPGYLPFDERYCKFELSRRGSTPATAVLYGPECAAFKCWLTSDLLLTALDGEPCGDGRGEEETSLQLLNGEDHQKKFSGCQGEPYRSHRAIVESILLKYFPSSP